MFLREPQGLEWGGAAGARPFGRALVPVAEQSPLERCRGRLARVDWVPDLGAGIGTATWWRGVATLVLLCAAAWWLTPGFGHALPGSVPAPLDGAEWDEARAQSIAPLAWGAATGRRMAANDLVAPLAQTPERPQVELDATLGDGDALDRVLERAGVGRSDAGAVARLVSGAVALGDIRPGTRLDLTLGRRPDRTVARPLERLAFRARFDLNLSLVRSAGALVMTRQPIAIDRTPLTVEGLVGASLYRSARAAGAPAKAIEDYIKAIATKLSIGRDVGADDRFRLVIDQARAATGEVQTGALQLAEIDQGSRPLRLVRFAQGGHDEWYDADGQVERQGFMGMPVAGHITSSFGMRFHPILGFSRMHKGIDIGAPTGTPVFAVVDGVVRSAGWTGGYGNFIKLAHAGALMTGYGHLSRIAVGAGQHVRRGEVIGYVGSTGMSTGPHLHWEVWKNGTAINPQSLSFASVATLSGEAMRAFRAKLSDLLAGRAPAR